MLTHLKAGSIDRRVKVDFSWPHGESINNKVSKDQYMGTLFKLKFPTVDDITDRIFMVTVYYTNSAYKGLFATLSSTPGI